MLGFCYLTKKYSDINKLINTINAIPDSLMTQKDIDFFNQQADRDTYYYKRSCTQKEVIQDINDLEDYLKNRSN
jgi:hypothetical protein